jgi:hypothetical protein
VLSTAPHRNPVSACRVLPVRSFCPIRPGCSLWPIVLSWFLGTCSHWYPRLFFFHSSPAFVRTKPACERIQQPLWQPVIQQTDPAPLASILMAFQTRFLLLISAASQQVDQKSWRPRSSFRTVSVCVSCAPHGIASLPACLLHRMIAYLSVASASLYQAQRPAAGFMTFCAQEGLRDGVYRVRTHTQHRGDQSSCPGQAARPVGSYKNSYPSQCFTIRPNAQRLQHRYRNVGWFWGTLRTRHVSLPGFLFCLAVVALFLSLAA